MERLATEAEDTIGILMPVLTNQRHELFAQALAKGMTQDKAYAVAGYKPDQPHANRLALNGMIKDRVAELQQKGAERAVITVESLIAEAEEVRRLAIANGQLPSAIAAIKEKGVLSGVRIER